MYGLKPIGTSRTTAYNSLDNLRILVRALHCTVGAAPITSSRAQEAHNHAGDWEEIQPSARTHKSERPRCLAGPSSQPNQLGLGGGRGQRRTMTPPPRFISRRSNGDARTPQRDREGRRQPARRGLQVLGSGGESSLENSLRRLGRWV